jgi:hypothetical protein
MHVKDMWRLTWLCALFLHDLTEGHRGRCNVVPTLSTFGFTLGPVPNVELDVGPVVCMMTAGVGNIDNVDGGYDSQKHNFPLIRVLAIYAKHNFVPVLAVDLHRDDGSPGLFRSQYSQVLGPENWE